MRRLIVFLSGRLKRFARNDRAVAAVEFALVLPIMLTLYLGAVEVSAAISVDKRVAAVAGSLGDLVARKDSTISSTNIDDYFAAVRATMAPYSSDNVQQIVSCVSISSTGVAKIGWSVADNGATRHTVGSLYTLTSDFKDLALDGYVIVAEAQLAYKPMFGYVVDTTFNLYHKYYFLPRFGEDIALDGKTCRQ